MSAPTTHGLGPHAAARSMWNKLTAAYGDPPDLAALAAASDEELRALGQSRQKAGYLRSLATLTLSGELDQLFDKAGVTYDKEAAERIRQANG